MCNLNDKKNLEDEGKNVLAKGSFTDNSLSSLLLPFPSPGSPPGNLSDGSVNPTGRQRSQTQRNYKCHKPQIPGVRAAAFVLEESECCCATSPRANVAHAPWQHRCAPGHGVRGTSCCARSGARQRIPKSSSTGKRSPYCRGERVSRTPARVRSLA